MLNKMLKNFFEKICQLPVITVFSRASDDIFTYSFCVVNFIGNYAKISLYVIFNQQTTSEKSFINFPSIVFKIME